MLTTVGTLVKNTVFCLLVGLAGALPTLAQSTPPTDELTKAKEIVEDLDKIVSPNGVQESYETIIGGIRQWVFVRGQDRRNPILLFVHGGPASPMAPVAWTFQRPLEEYFTGVYYDQRAAGKTYAANDTTGLGPTIRID